jgi:lipopolysaccharide transport system permease protein
VGSDSVAKEFWLALVECIDDISVAGTGFVAAFHLLAYIGARFRDVPHATGLIMQALWFISPVYFEVKMFRKGGLDILVDYNPIYHVLQLVRAPLLDGVWPTLANYMFPLMTAVIFGLLAWLVGRSAEKKVIFYL